MIRAMRRVKSFGWVLIALMIWLYGGGRIHAENYAASTSRVVPVPRVESRFDALLSEVKELVSREGTATKSAPGGGFTGIRRLAELRESLAKENEKNLEYFSRLESLVEKKGLDAEILGRHQEFAREYNARYEALMANIDSIESAHNGATGFWAKLTGASKKVDWDGVIGKAMSFLAANTPRPRKSHFDPKNLPHRSLRADKPIPPKLTREEWLRAFAKNSSQDGSASAQSSAKVQSSVTVAATTPPADLAETIEVKFTPGIRQLADSLGKNPVKIFNWVRNNIEFVPTWGSIQGGQLCMENRAGNAFDTASLLVALLRYSGTPARYQMGTIEVPIDKFMNWAGGFTNAEAAASLFASAGVPSVVQRVNQSGQLVSVRLEHVWVKAFVDYAPSGGAVNRQGDTWVELDAGFKQYSFSSGLDFETVVPSNFQPFAIETARSATIDNTTGSVTGLNTASMTSFVQQLADQRINYLRTNLPNATVREVLGGKSIVSNARLLLPATAPYRVLARANELAQIPDSLRHRVTFAMGSNPQTPDTGDLLSFSASLPELAGKNILLLYQPASPADEQLLAQLETQSAIPAFLNLVPQLYVGSQLVATGAAVRAGRALTSQIAFSAPTIITPTVFNTATAGEVAAIGLDLQGIPQSQLQALRDKAQEIRDRLQQGTFQSLTRRDYAEVILSSSIIGWFGSVDANDRLTARGAGAVSLRYPSAGLFFVKLRASSLFGAPASVSLDGMAMDVDRDIVVSLAKDGNADKVVSLSSSQGTFGSANEAEIPVRLLSTPEQPVSGVATIQALQIANDQGIPIYRINAPNAATIIPLLQIDPSDLADIQDAISAGLEVTVSKTPVNFNGRTVLGTVISDPSTGSASFLISGGNNGAIIFAFSLLALGLLLLVLGIVAAPLAIILGVILAIAILIIVFLIGGGEAFENSRIFNLSPCELLAVTAAVLLLGIAAIAVTELIVGGTLVPALALALGVNTTVALDVLTILAGFLVGVVSGAALDQILNGCS